MRIKIIHIGITILFLIIALDLFYVQVIRGRYFYHLSKNNRVRIVPVDGERGRIYDRYGRVLADNHKTYNVMVTPQDIGDQQELFQFLSETLRVPSKKILQRYRVKKFTPFTPVMVARNISKEKAIVIEENKYRFPSLFVAKSFKRVYPLKKNSAHVLGYVGVINQAKRRRLKEYGYAAQSLSGYTGVEEYYDTYLRSSPGGKQIEVNSRGRQVRLLSLKEPARGSDITLTIDHNVQQIAMELLAKKTGAIVVMDMANGEILGLVSSPAFDPNIRKPVSRHSPFLNRAIAGAFPPGSVFKVPVAVGGLDSQKITARTSFMCNGSYELGGITFRCTHHHGAQNLMESLAHSCNIYYYRLGLKMGADSINRYARMFGLGSLTHVDLPYEKAGRIPDRNKGVFSARRKWYTGDTLNFSIGQGDVLTTPLQLVKMMAIVGNEGREVQPHIIKNIGSKRVDKYAFNRRIKISKQVFKFIQQGLRATVTDFSGTAHVLNLTEVYVAGKTGTAQSSRNKEHHSWFVGYAKAEKKNIAFCVFLEHGGSSQNACLVARKLLLRLKEEKIL